MPGRGEEVRCEFVARDGSHERAEDHALLVEVGEHGRHGTLLLGDESKAFIELGKKVVFDFIEQDRKSVV